MWILKKTSKELLKTLSPRSQYACSIIKTFNVSALYRYTTIPHTQLKYRIKELMQYCFSQKKWEQYLVITCNRDKFYTL